MAYSGLETIFQNEGPLSGAATAGQREGLAQIADLQTMAKTQQAYDQAELMNPLDVQFRRGQVAQQAPELEKALLANQKTRGTIQSDIAAENSKNESQITTDQVTKVSNMGRMAGELGVMLSGIPPGLQRTQAATQYMMANGIDPQSKAGQYVLNNDPQALIEISDKIAKRRDAYIQAMGTAEKSKESNIEGIKAQKEADRKLEEFKESHGHISYQKRAVRGAQDALEKALTSGKWDQAATAYDRMAQIAQAAGNQEDALFYQTKAKEYSDKYLQSRQAPKPGSVDIQEATGLATQPPVTAPAPALKGQTPTAGTTKSGVKYRVIGQ